MSLVFAAACDGDDRAPLYPGEDDDAQGGAGGEIGDGSGGVREGSGGGGGTGGDANPGSGGAPSELERPEHSIFYYAQNVTNLLDNAFCEVLSGDTVGLPGDLPSDILGQVEPTTGVLWVLSDEAGAAGSVRDVRDHENVCGLDVTDFSFHPVTGELASACDGAWFDGGGIGLPIPARYRDEGDLRFFDGKLYDENDLEIELSGALPEHWLRTPSEPYHVHSRPGGGFWLVDYDSTSSVAARWSITTTGDVELDGTFTFPSGFLPGPLSFVLDDLGALYNDGVIGSTFVTGTSAVSRSSSDFTSAEILYDSRDGDCTASEEWGHLFTTP